MATTYLSDAVDKLDATTAALVAAPAVAAISYCAANYFGSRYREQELRRQTCVPEVDQIGTPRTEKIKGTAVVCGGGYSGIVAARILHDHFERVVVIEAEPWLNTEEGKMAHSWEQKSRRTRIMQYESLNTHDGFVFRSMSRLFPNWRNECAASGMHVGKPIPKLHFWGIGARCKPEELPDVHFTSRQGQETIMRRLTMDRTKYPNIEQITGLVVSMHGDPDDPKRIQKVSVRTSEGTIDIHGALFLDCTGTAQGPKWLQRAGYADPKKMAPGDKKFDEVKTEYNPHVRYSTLEFNLSEGNLKRFEALIPPSDSKSVYGCMPHPEKDNTSVYIAQRDGGLIHVCGGGYGNAPTPETIDDFIEFSKARYMEKPYPEYWWKVLDLLRECEDEMTVSKVVVPPRSYMRWDQVGDLPANWLAVGDAVLRVNPVYAQGLSHILHSMATMDACFREMWTDKQPAPSKFPDSFARNFFARQHQKILPIWESNKTSDYAFSTTTPCKGETLEKGAWLRWYFKRLRYLMQEDTDITTRMAWVGSFLAPDVDVLAPSVLRKVVWDVIKRPYVG
ncbi:hypothetical protein BD626DRAFT_402159 [Schizophyllum amplum]|uniref:FAD/NAD(P)-binding domain-containing protein n=1 Tax=Schizophyllum amplum TaxID=97359 RepID=A0A550CFG3_9AGAR|nr:hypothetical protein BD626DRAFT_402159 [Auriculariopsis ampla]